MAFLIAEALAICANSDNIILLLTLVLQLYMNPMVWYETIGGDQMVCRYCLTAIENG